mgnify:CR=1 FL=1
MASLNLDAIYSYRFDGISHVVKQKVWDQIAEFILNDAVRFRDGEKVASILDPACGDGEFLNGCANGDLDLMGCDLRSRSTTLHPSINFHQGYFQTLDFNKKYDLIWISNLLEHLPSPETLQEFLSHAGNLLSPNGLIVIMGPNIKYCYTDYWDFADHLLPLSHLTVCEHLLSAGFETLACTAKFLPYSFRSRLPPSSTLARLYLNFPLAWNLLGKQFLIRARKT